MMEKNPELLEKIRQQFNTIPYPTSDLDVAVDDSWESLYVHNLVTAYYLRYQKVTKTEGKLILDGGCGTGYKSLTLVKANPGAKIVGIDISEKSIDFARKRFESQGVKGAEFHVLALEDITELGYEFDYINVDEVLHLCGDVEGVLGLLKSVLKPEGIIRANFPSDLQRGYFFQAQEMCRILGLGEGNSIELGVNQVREIMEALKDDAIVKMKTWRGNLTRSDVEIMTNYLLLETRGYTIPEIFQVLGKANLHLISMCNWRHWELRDLFEDANNLPFFWEMGLGGISLEESLHLFELLQPTHERLDFWCGSGGEGDKPLCEWDEEDWSQGRVCLHPQLQDRRVREDLEDAIRQHQVFEISRYIPLPSLVPIGIDCVQGSCLLPLWEGTQPVRVLVERWLELSPVDPIKLTPLSWEEGEGEVRRLMKKLEAFLYVLLER